MKTQCPNCKSRFSVSQISVGKQAKCPKCSNPFIIEPLAETLGAIEEVTTPAEASVKTPQPIKPPVKTETPAAIPSANDKKSVSNPTSKAVLPKMIFVYGWAIVRIITGVLGALGLMMALRKESHSTLVKIFAAADVFLIIGIVIELMLYYRMWAAIKDDEASASPVTAVLFLFVPFFNIYWMLNMLIGFAEDYNDFIQQRSMEIKKLPVMLFVIYAFLSIITAIGVTLPMFCVFAVAGRINGAFNHYSFESWTVFFFISAASMMHFITYIAVSIKTCNVINALTNELAKGR